MAFSTVPKVRRDGKITLKDGGSASLEVAYEEGNLTFEITKSDQTVIRDRGVITTVRKGDDQPAATGSFSAYMREFADQTNAGSIIDFINKTNAYSGNTSATSSGVYVEEYSINIEFDVEGTDFGDDGDHKAVLTQCICTVSFTEGDPSMFNLSFTCYGGVTLSGPGT
jgi:hypothetical protein